MSAFVFAAPALADTTINWTGNGVTNGELDELGDDCEQHPEGYLHWVLTAAGAESATITINGTTFDMEQGGEGSGAFHYFSGWYDLATVEASATYVGEVTGNVILTISHGCPPQVQELEEFLQVVKVVDPDTDTTEFSFGFTGEVSASARGPHGTMTEKVEVVEGTYTIAERPVEGYSASIRCVLRDTDTEVGSGAGTSLNIDVTDGQDVVCTITNVLDADEAGMADVQIHKWVCAGDETTTTIEIFGPVGIASAEDQAPEEGCERASEPWEFVILDSEGNPVQAYDDEGAPLASIMTGATGTVRVSIETDEDGEDFTLVELHPDIDPDPSRGFTLATGELITFRVANFFGEGELPTGEVKILKSFCGEFEDGLVRFSVNGVFQDELENIDLEPCEASDDFSFYFDGDTEATFSTTNGLYVEALGEGEHTLTEVETGATVTFTVVAGEETEIEVFNWAPASAADTATIMVMKHNCADVTTMAEFEDVEARAATNPTTPDAAFGPTVETVLECPTVVLPGDEQTADTVAGGESTFEFTVADAGGTATLSTDGAFVATAACEIDVEYDADRSGEPLDDDVCLDLSHYEFEVSADGQVTVTETVSPSGLVFGALRFTPGSGDDAALVSVDNGVIVLDTSADEDGMIMLHVYNFAEADVAGEEEENEQRDDTLGGQLPNTSTAPDMTGSVPAAVLALVMLTGLGAAGYAMQAEARRRR